jgi:hypothetical protein
VILFWVKQKRVLPPDYSRLVPVKSTAGDTQWAQRFKNGPNRPPDDIWQHICRFCDLRAREYPRISSGNGARYG